MALFEYNDEVYMTLHLLHKIFYRKVLSLNHEPLPQFVTIT